jgi:hypothetical protein
MEKLIEAFGSTRFIVSVESLIEALKMIPDTGFSEDSVFKDAFMHNWDRRGIDLTSIKCQSFCEF